MGPKTFTRGPLAKLSTLRGDRQRSSTATGALPGPEPRRGNAALQTGSASRPTLRMLTLAILAVFFDVRFRSQGVGDFFPRTRRDGLVGLELWRGRLFRAGVRSRGEFSLLRVAANPSVGNGESVGDLSAVSPESPCQAFAYRAIRNRIRRSKRSGSCSSSSNWAH